MQRQSRYLWLILPPILAAAFLLGPWGPGQTEAIAPAQLPQEASSRVPPTPDIWQIASALVGVLVLGISSVVLIAKFKNGSMPSKPPREGSLISLRQSLRLSAKQRVHAIEFQSNLLLLAECDGNITILQNTSRSAAETDEWAVRSRDLDEATEKEVPRKTTARPVKRSPKQRVPATKKKVATRQVKRPRPATTSLDSVTASELADFKRLLQQTRRKVSG